MLAHLTWAGVLCGRPHKPNPTTLESTLKQKFSALLAALVLVLAGTVATAAPAQAVWGSSIYYSGQGPGISDNVKLPVTHMGDYIVVQVPLGWVADDSFRTRPPSIAYKLWYTNPKGQTGVIRPGEWLVPKYQGIYRVSVDWA